MSFQSSGETTFDLSLILGAFLVIAGIVSVLFLVWFCGLIYNIKIFTGIKCV